ncbi:2-isopropylmalate synthase [Methanoplanus sp. FWC-SCC4]|uniref:Probable 2-isopropylmalate synthase n=1 Tax=Methanochimaera problematica TaxID=2609417 RepID=A0AA97I454_9EURY|nr:2-isopropylmalate synthase [Methanoplanus sp. FWC-SCC4]WOF17353.1 2-isopropylmalate synthase [Methanoplanus sp. FWC-SCC4]
MGFGESLNKRQVAFFTDNVKNSEAFRKVTVFDTTLRDGEQTPGVSFTLDQKIEIARHLSEIGVDVIEAGFPASSDVEFQTVRKIAGENTGAKICGLARSVKSDVDRCIDSGVDMVHVFIPTSEIQREHTIKKTHEEVLEIIREIVDYACSGCDQVMFSAMDATRTNPVELIEAYMAADEAGAAVINVPDTVGVFTPSMMKPLVSQIREKVRCKIDVHCHNDFGLAVANTIAAVEGGADQVQVTVNGIGERAGNADISQTVMIMEAICGISTNIRTEKLVETSRLVSRLSGIPILPIQPVVGENAFSHESGIHSHGVMSDPKTFEPGIMTPEMVGHRRRLKLGKHVGRHAVRQMLSDAGINPDEETLDRIIFKVKEISGKGKKVTEYDLFEIADSIMGTSGAEKAIVLDDISIFTGNHALPTASVRAIVRGEEKIFSATGDGPVDAAMKALLGIFPGKIELKSYQVEAISGGSDAIGSVTISVEDNKGHIFDAGASGSDIVLASAEAMVNGINIVCRSGGFSFEK